MPIKRNHGREVTFICKRMPVAARAYLAGSFNGWKPEQRRMRRMRDGTFRARLKLPPGEHQYKFVCDGVWLHDPEADGQVPDGQGHLNSVVWVP